MDHPFEDALAGAETYESLHVPALFAEWAPRVLNAAKVEVGHRLLDVACGTGVLARRAVERVGPEGHVVGLDPNPGMLAVAARLHPGIEWRAGNAEELPFGDMSFDRVLSQFGLTFFSGPARAVREMVRVAVPGGRIAFAVWDRIENAPAYAAELALLERMAGAAAADALRAPFALGDADLLRALVDDAVGLPVEVSTVVGRGRYPSIRAMVEADLRGWLPVMGVELDEDVVVAILSAAESELAGFSREDGRMEFDVPGHVVTARRPRDFEVSA